MSRRLSLAVHAGLLACLAILLAPGPFPFTAAAKDEQEHCKDRSDDPAGCQPSTYDVPIGRIPGTRVNAHGEIDPFSSDTDAVKGGFHLEKKLRLFRNFTHLHWIPLVPSVVNPVTGAKSGGDLDSDGDGRGLGIAGNCVFVGHSNGVGVSRGVNILRLREDPEENSPVLLPETIPAVVSAGRGFDDRELRAILYTTTGGQERMLLARDPTAGQDGRYITYAINPATCLPTSQSNTVFFGGELHEFFLWHDSKNPNRILVGTAHWGGAGRPDMLSPGNRVPDIQILAITDENTGEVLRDPQVLATFSLQDVGGPVLLERPDATGLFSDGRFPDFSHLTDSFGRPAARQTEQRNFVHSLTISEDGERVYVAGSLAGFYILNSEAVAHNTNAALAAGTAGCNKRSTNVYVGGVIGGEIDLFKASQVAFDCLHMVIHDDPGFKAIFTSGASVAVQALRYRQLHDRSRFDPYPPVMTFTGFHSAVFVPNRPSLTRGNTKGRPALVVISDEKPSTECPNTWVRIMNVDSEISPTQEGSFGVPMSRLETCLTQPNTEPNGEPRRGRSQQAHNPTVFRNLIFISWYGQGVRAIDISLSQTPREVGYARTAPHGVARTGPSGNRRVQSQPGADQGLLPE